MVPASDRAVSEVVGAIFVFGFLVIGFTIYQGVIIPDQNRSIEFEHNVDVHDTFQDLRNAIREAGISGDGRSVSVSLGVDYPNRAIAINPGRAAGSLHTESLGEVGIRNISASDGSVDEYISNSRLGSFESKALVYRPAYVYYSEAPESRYENGLAYNHFPNGANITLTGQAIVDDRKITIITLSGNLSKAQTGAVSVDPKALSAGTNKVTVTNTSGRVNITIPTKLPASEWSEMLEGELTTNGGHVIDVRSTGENQVSIVLEKGVTYELRLAKVGIGDGTTDPTAKYIMAESGNGSSVAEGGTQQLVVEVRDRFNNPVSNVSVSSAHAKISPSSETTDADGQVTFTYTAPDNVDETLDDEVEMTFDGGGDGGNKSVKFSVSVTNSDGSSGASSGGYSVAWNDPSGLGDNSDQSFGSCDSASCVWNADTAYDPTLTLQMETNPAFEGVNVDYAVDASSVGTLSPGDGLTNAAGMNETVLTGKSNGTVGTIVTADGGSARINITVVLPNIEEWPLSGYDAENTGAGNSHGPTSGLSKAWSDTADNEIKSSPVVANERIYFGSKGTTLYSYDRDGTQQWTRSLDGEILASPGVSNGEIFVGTKAGTLYAYDEAGTQQWTASLDGEILGPPSIVSGTVYIGTKAGTMYAIATSDGSEEWTFSTGGEEIRSGPAVTGGTVYFGTKAGQFYAVDASTGSQDWSQGLNSQEIHSAPAIADGTIYIGTKAGTLYALATSDGSEQWTFSTGSEMHGSPAVTGGVVYIGDKSGSLYAVQASDGSQKWSYSDSEGDEIRGASAVVDGAVYFGDKGGEVHVLNSSDGSELDSYTTNGEIKWGLAVVNGRIYVGTKSNEIYAIGGS